MGARLGVYNWPPIPTSWGEKMSSRLDIYHQLLFTFPEAGDTRAPDNVFMTGFLSIFRDLRLNIKTSHGNRVNSRTLGIFMAGTELD